MSKKIINLVTYVLTFGLCAFLIWVSLKDLKPEDIAKIKFSVSKAKYILLVPILTMGLLSHWSRAVRWKYLMEPLGMHPGTRNTFFAVMIGYLANMFLPRLGEVIKCTVLSRYEKIPADKLVGTIITERVFDILCLLLIFVITIVVQTELAGQYLHDLKEKYQRSSGGGTHSTIWIILGVVVLMLFLFRKHIAKFHLVQRIRQMLKNVVSGIMSFQKMKKKKEFLFHTVLIWSLYFGMIQLGFQSIQETSMLGYKTSLSVLSFGSVGMIATPGGMGAYTLLVEEIVRLYGIDQVISLAISWIIWLVPTIIILFGGLFSLIFLPILNSKSKHAV